jgi:hypothetical protein
MEILVGFTLAALGAAMAAWACRRWSWCPLGRVRRERVVEVSLVLLGLVQEMQLHRGLSGAVLDGRKAFRDDLEANEEKLQRSLRVVAEQHRRRYPVFAGADWRLVVNRWESLRGNWRDLPFATNIAAHSDVIEALIGILAALLGSHRRLLGARRAEVAIAWTRLIEDLGQLRAEVLHLLGHPAKAMDPAHVDSVTVFLHAARRRLALASDLDAPRALGVRTQRALQRIEWLLDGNAERYHPYTFYEEITGLIDDWYATLRAELRDERVESAPRPRSARWRRLNPKAG